MAVTGWLRPYLVLNNIWYNIGVATNKISLLRDTP